MGGGRQHRPNVLFIMADQHNARCLSAEGHEVVDTPSLDRLANEGVRFSRAFAQNPICTPSRVSFLSGRYCQNHGYFGLSDPRQPGPPGRPDFPSLFSILKSSGYTTAVVGKTHTPAQWLEPHLDLLADCAGFLATDAYGEHLARLGLNELRDDRMLPEHYERYGDSKGQGLDARPSALPLEHSVESWVAEQARRFIAGHAAQPWAAWVSFPRPHQVWTPAREFWDRYADRDIAFPPNADDPLVDKPPHQARIRREKVAEGDWYFEPRTPEAGKARVLRGYYALVSQTDHFVGTLLQALDELDLAQDTIVLYSADHGDFAGEHGFIEKAPGISYDAITRVPMIWRWPSRFLAGHVCEELVESVDVLPTLLASLGLPASSSVDGIDLSNLLQGRQGVGKDHVVTENPWAKSIRDKEWKLVEYPRAMFPDEPRPVGELYHLASDPWEIENRYYDLSLAGVVSDLRRALIDWMVTTKRVKSALPASWGTWQRARTFADPTVPTARLAEMAREGATGYL